MDKMDECPYSKWFKDKYLSLKYSTYRCDAWDAETGTCTYPRGLDKCKYYTLYMTKRKDEETMENKTLEKTMDLAGSAMKLAANLSEKKDKPTPKAIPVADDNSNKAATGSQTVVVSMDGKKKDPKPVEKHIHEFPENRALTSEECELALKKAQMEYELKKSEQEYAIKINEREWKHKMELEEKNERKGKIRRVIGGVLIALGIGGIGYSCYADYRDHKLVAGAVPVIPKALPSTMPVTSVKAEGSVE